MEWKKYKCLDRTFEVSDTGKVRNEQGKPLKGSLQSGGFRTINFRFNFNGERFNKTLIIHRMVATCWVENLEVKPYVIHLNGDVKDNRAKNLAWATADEKIVHQKRKGKLSTNYRLTHLDVARIKKMLAENELTIEAISKKFNVSHTQIQRIKRGENWSGVTSLL
jgi:hypothetical protein